MWHVDVLCNSRSPPGTSPDSRRALAAELPPRKEEVAASISSEVATAPRPTSQGKDVNLLSLRDAVEKQREIASDLRAGAVYFVFLVLYLSVVIVQLDTTVVYLGTQAMQVRLCCTAWTTPASTG